MTRKDFELIAAALQLARDTRKATSAIDDQIANYMADALDKANPRFDRARFLKACGLEVFDA